MQKGTNSISTTKLSSPGLIFHNWLYNKINLWGSVAVSLFKTKKSAIIRESSANLKNETYFLIKIYGSRGQLRADGHLKQHIMLRRLVQISLSVNEKIEEI